MLSLTFQNTLLSFECNFFMNRLLECPEDVALDQTLDDIEESLMQEEIDEEDKIELLANEEQFTAAYSKNYARQDYGDLSDEIMKVNEVKCVAALSQLISLLGTKCRHENCNESFKDIRNFVVQYCIKLECICKKGHRWVWYSSPFYAAGLAINYIIDSSLLLSGGQITQFKRFCTFSGIGRCTSTSFYRNQRLYVSPTVEQEFQEMRRKVVTEAKRKGSDIVICGDARMDSPGFSATKGAYTLMDYSSKKIFTMEFGDKREVSYFMQHLTISFDLIDI